MTTPDPYELDHADPEAPPADHTPTVEERLTALESAMTDVLESFSEGMERVVRQ